MKISDDLRELAGEAGIYSNARTKLRKLADRIDLEMVELPKDADGVPIMFEPRTPAEWSEMDYTERGTAGFGSTGDE